MRNLEDHLIYIYVMSVVESECTVAFTSHLSVTMKLIWLNYMYKALVSALTMYRTYLCGLFVYSTGKLQNFSEIGCFA